MNKLPKPRKNQSVIECKLFIDDMRKDAVYDSTVEPNTILKKASLQAMDAIARYIHEGNLDGKMTVYIHAYCDS